MRISNRIVLAVVAALAAMAFMAVHASAQETEVEVVEEDGTACNPCAVHIVSPGCNVVNCAINSPHWPLTVGELVEGREHTTVNFCF